MIKTYRISNTSSSPVTIFNYYLTGSSQFTITTPPARTIAPHESTTISVTFTPNGVGGTKSTVLTIINNTSLPVMTQNISVTEEDDGSLVVSPLTLDYTPDGGTKTISITSVAPYTVQVKNVKGAINPFASVTVSGNSVIVVLPVAASTNQRSFDLNIISGAHTIPVLVTQVGKGILSVSLDSQPSDTCTRAIYDN